MTKKWILTGVTALAVLLLLVVLPVVEAQLQNPPSNQSYVGGKFIARNYVYPGVRVNSGSVAAGASGTLTLSAGNVKLQDGRTIVPFNAGGTTILGTPGIGVAIPLQVGAGTVQEIVTPTAVSSGCALGFSGYNDANPCTITATFTYAHGRGEVVTSGSAGVQEAIADAYFWGGGVVVVDPSEAQLLTVNTLTPTVTGGVQPAVMPNVSIEDDRYGVTRFWNITPTGVMLAVPTTLTSQAACDSTHQFCSDATVAGSASWGSTVYGCVAYVDVAGNEGPCSLTSTVFTSVASKAIDVAAPAASPGAVGYVVYLSLSGGTYAQAYQIPSTSSNCTLTTIETVTPACAVANTTYGQAASTFGALSTGLFTKGGSQITTYPLNTGQHFTGKASIVQTTASYTPLSNSSVTYAYAPSSRVAACPGMSSPNTVAMATAAGTSASSTAAIPMAMGTVTIPANCFNYIGAEFRMSGKFTFTEGGTSAATYNLVVAWDSALANSTTIPTPLCTIANTHTPAAAAQNGYFSCTARILTAGATGTAVVNGWGDFSIATGQALLIGFANDTAVAASAATVNTTVPARITAQLFDSGNTVTGAQPLELTFEVLN